MYKPEGLATNGNRLKCAKLAIPYLFKVPVVSTTLWTVFLRWTREVYPHTPSSFLNGFTRFGKMTPEDFQKTGFRHKPEHFHPCSFHFGWVSDGESTVCNPIIYRLHIIHTCSAWQAQEQIQLQILLGVNTFYSNKI